VGGDEDGAVGGAELGEELDHLLDGFHVHVGEGLVEEEEFGLGEQDAGERGALPHALGVLAYGAGQGRVESDLAEGFFRREAGVGGVEGAEVGQVFGSGEFVVEHGGVAHVADAVAGGVGRLSVEDGDFALGGLEESGEDAEKGGFAGAVFAKEDVAAAGGEVDGDLAEGGERAEEARDGGKAGERGGGEGFWHGVWSWNWRPDARIAQRGCAGFGAVFGAYVHFGKNGVFLCSIDGVCCGKCVHYAAM